ncbi:lactate 2-monooxygenase [Microdochium nivale]|nr:lactate 2-monooxygenase [Microdochium nivale]
METPAPTQGRRKILFLTNSDRGEFGVVIATAQAMLEVSPADIELHIGTYAGVEELIAQVSDESVRLNPQAVPITYHNIAKSAAYLDTLALLKSRNIETKPLYLPMSYLRKPSFSNTLQAIQDTASVLVPMDGPKMERIVLQALEIIGAVKPDFIVINSVMAVGLTAAVHSKIPSCILSPNSIKDLSSSLQPYGAVFWKFPHSSRVSRTRSRGTSSPSTPYTSCGQQKSCYLTTTSKPSSSTLRRARASRSKP